MAHANPLWRAPRIHGELLKLGIGISEHTVSRILRTLKRPPSQTWKTLLKSRMGEMVATDFFTFTDCPTENSILLKKRKRQAKGNEISWV